MTDTTGDYDQWAWLYDRTLGPDYRDRKMGFLERTLLRDLPAGSRVLDLCCGTGQMIAPMLARGFAVTGLDLSRDMLRFAAQNAPGAVFVQGDAREFRFDTPFAGVICASASLNHMATADDLARVFRAVHGALDEGGVFVFDVNHPQQMAVHWRGEPAAGEIRADYAWLITPRYDVAKAEGAFRVDMYQPAAGRPVSALRRLWLKLLNRPFLRRLRLKQLTGFAQRHPGWNHRAADYPVHGHDLAVVAQLLRDSGFACALQTFSGQGVVDANSAACFVCRKQAQATRMEAAE